MKGCWDLDWQKVPKQMDKVRWWALFCILNGMGGTWCWSIWSVVLSLDGMCNEGRWMASIRRSFQFGEAKFLLAKFLSSGSNECLLVYVCLSVGVLENALCQWLWWGMNALTTVWGFQHRIVFFSHCIIAHSRRLDKVHSPFSEVRQSRWTM